MKIAILILQTTTMLWSLTLDEALSRAEQFSPELKRAEANVRYTKALKSEAYANYYPTLSASYLYKYRDEATLFSRTDSYQYGLTGTYNLFNGLADSLNVKSAKEQVKISNLQKSATKADLVLAVKSRYIELLKIKKEVSVQIDALKLLSKQYSDVKNRFELGISAKNELLQVDVSLQNTKHALLKAKSAKIKKRAELLKLLNGNLKVDEIIEEIDNIDFPTLSLNSLKKEMLEQRSELKLLKRKTNQLKMQKNIIRADYMPKVNLTLNHTIYDQSERLGTSIALPKDETTATVNATWKLFEGGKTIAQEEAKLEELSINNSEIDLLIQNLEFQLYEAYEDYLLAKNSQKIAKHSLASAKENYRIISDLNSEGNIEAVTLLDARLDLTQSQMLLNNAQLDLYIAHAKLERIVESKIR